jgi:hypothetical protein
MTLEQLKESQSKLVLQRAQAKDMVENTEKALSQIGFAIQVLEAQTAEPAPAPLQEVPPDSE